FVFEHGDRYLREVPPEKHSRLYPIGDLLLADGRVAASSDAPVAAIGALEGLRAAIARRTRAGAVLGPAQAVDFEAALAMWTRAGAEACGLGATRGGIAPGMAADFVLLSEASERAEVVAVYVRGELVAPVPVERPHLRT
ncbi:MAG: amidohydrolase family protein, partial [Dehalococcoidia bacterium]